MLYDCFNFLNELELLDIRLHELDKIVDKFVLVESTVTFTNKKKPLIYDNNKSQFKKYHKKIEHIIVADSPNVFGNPWIIENHQLSSVLRGLKYCKEDDYVLISCVDEIPKAERVSQWLLKPGKHKAFEQNLTYYYLNYFVNNNESWLGTRLYKYKDLLSYKSPYIARFTPVDVRIPDGGWHFSYIGGIKRVQTKLASFSHQEFNNSEYNTEEKILLAMREGKDLFQRGLKFKFAKYSLLPKYVQENSELFKGYLSEPKSLNKICLSYLRVKSKTRTFVRNLLKIAKS